MMKNLLLLSITALLLVSCSATIPLQASLNDQTMLLADNKNIKIEYTLDSNIPNGPITVTTIQKNGNARDRNDVLEYESATAFFRIWESYFSNKFNDYSEDVMDVNVDLVDLKLIQKSATSIGATMFTGNVKFNLDALAKVHVVVNYHGEKYENEFEVIASDYNETQTYSSGNSYYTASETNIMKQRAKLLESALNKAVIQFENFVSSVILQDNSAG